jgi:hypothetical protein
MLALADKNASKAATYRQRQQHSDIFNTAPEKFVRRVGAQRNPDVWRTARG